MIQSVQLDLPFLWRGRLGNYLNSSSLLSLLSTIRFARLDFSILNSLFKCRIVTISTSRSVYLVRLRGLCLHWELLHSYGCRPLIYILLLATDYLITWLLLDERMIFRSFLLALVFLLLGFDRLAGTLTLINLIGNEETEKEYNEDASAYQPDCQHS